MLMQSLVAMANNHLNNITAYIKMQMSGAKLTADQEMRLHDAMMGMCSLFEVALTDPADQAEFCEHFVISFFSNCGESRLYRIPVGNTDVRDLKVDIYFHAPHEPLNDKYAYSIWLDHQPLFRYRKQ